MKEITREIEEKLESYLQGELAPEEKAEVADLLKNSSEYREYLDFLANIRRVSAKAPVKIAPAHTADKISVRLSKSKTVYSPWVPVFSASVVFLLVGIFLGKQWSSNQQITGVASQFGDKQQQVMSVMIKAVQEKDRASRIQAVYIFEQKKPEAGEVIDLLTKALQSQDVWTALNDHVSQLYREGNLEQAAQKAQEALNMAQTLWVPEHPNVALAIRNMGVIYSAQKKYDLAEQFLRQSLKICEKTAEAVAAAGQSFQGQPALEQARQTHERSQILIHRYDESVTLRKLAELYNAQGKSVEAHSLLTQADQIEQDIVSSQNNAGELL